MDDEFGKFVSGEPVTRQAMVVATHCTVTAILATIIGNLDDAAHEHASAKHRVASRQGPSMNRRLLIPSIVQPQKVLPRLTH